MDEERIRLVEKARTLCTKYDYDFDKIANYIEQEEEDITHDLAICIGYFFAIHDYLSLFNSLEQEKLIALEALESCLIFGIQENIPSIIAEIFISVRYQKLLSDGLIPSPKDLISEEEYNAIASNALSNTKDFAPFYLLLKELGPQGFSQENLFVAHNIWLSCYENGIDKNLASKIALYWLRTKFQPTT